MSGKEARFSFSEIVTFKSPLNSFSGDLAESICEMDETSQEKGWNFNVSCEENDFILNQKFDLEIPDYINDILSPKDDCLLDKYAMENKFKAPKTAPAISLSSMNSPLDLLERTYSVLSGLKSDSSDNCENPLEKTYLMPSSISSDSSDNCKNPLGKTYLMPSSISSDSPDRCGNTYTAISSAKSSCNSESSVYFQSQSATISEQDEEESEKENDSVFINKPLEAFKKPSEAGFGEGTLINEEKPSPPTRRGTYILKESPCAVSVTPKLRRPFITPSSTGFKTPLSADLTPSMPRSAQASYSNHFKTPTSTPAQKSKIVRRSNSFNSTFNAKSPTVPIAQPNFKVVASPRPIVNRRSFSTADVTISSPARPSKPAAVGIVKVNGHKETKSNPAPRVPISWRQPTKAQPDHNKLLQPAVTLKSNASGSKQPNMAVSKSLNVSRAPVKAVHVPPDSAEKNVVPSQKKGSLASGLPRRIPTPGTVKKNPAGVKEPK